MSTASNRLRVKRTHILDLARCATLGDMEDFAFPSERLFRPQSFAAAMLRMSIRQLAPGYPSTTWICADKTRVHSIVSAKQRSSAESWEVSHLMASAALDPSLSRVLERAAVDATARGAQRIFLRTPDEYTIARVAQEAGFVPCAKETLYSGMPKIGEGEGSLFGASARLRTRQDQDDLALFRLYNAVTPVKTRQYAGMTFDQWRASQERAEGQCQEQVLDMDGEVKGWMRISLKSGTGMLSVMLHPELEGLTAEMVDAGLRYLDRANIVISMCPEFYPSLAAAFERRRFEAKGDFRTMVKPAAAAVRDVSLAKSSLPAIK